MPPLNSIMTEGAANIEKILTVLLSLCLLLTGCGTSDIEERKTHDGIMLSATNVSWGLVDRESDYWACNEFEVFYDGRIHLTANYHLSGAVVDYETELSDQDYQRLVEILVNDFAAGKCDRDVDACDGSGWYITYYDTDGNLNHSVDGYIYGIEPLEEMGEILRFYMPEYERPPLYPD